MTDASFIATIVTQYLVITQKRYFSHIFPYHPHLILNAEFCHGNCTICWRHMESRLCIVFKKKKEEGGMKAMDKERAAARH